jgi:hypothetical protein
MIGRSASVRFRDALAGWCCASRKGEAVKMRHPYEKRKVEAWEWCLTCEKPFPASDWQRADWDCPLCGSGTQNMWPWSTVRAANPAYPEQPERGVLYPLYPVRAASEGQASSV